MTAWQYLGDTYYNMKLDSLAVEAYLKTLKLDPERDVILYNKLAEVEGNIGMYEEALEHITIFLQNPDLRSDFYARKRLNNARIMNLRKRQLKNPVNFNPVNMCFSSTPKHA